jgi:hypothetical protein
VNTRSTQRALKERGAEIGAILHAAERLSVFLSSPQGPPIIGITGNAVSLNIHDVKNRKKTGASLHIISGREVRP